MSTFRRTRPAKGDNGDIATLWLSVHFEDIATYGPEDIAHSVAPLLHKAATISLAATDMLVSANECLWRPSWPILRTGCPTEG